MGMAIAMDVHKIVIVDPHTMVREAVATLLSSGGFDVVGTAGCSAEALSVVRDTRPDVVIMESELEDGPGIYCATRIKEVCSQTKVLFITSNASEHTALMAIGMGVEGYILKTTSLQDLTRALLTIGSGGRVFDPVITAPMVERIAKVYRATHNTDEPSYSDGLSSREREIAGLASQGLSNEEIAGLTFVSINTVKSHLRRVYQQLGISSRRHLIKRRTSPEELQIAVRKQH